MSTTATTLLVALFVGHFLGDFTPLATARMQKAKAQGGPMGPIAAHAGVHTLLAAISVLAVLRPGLSVVAAVAAVELVTHFAIDAVRARIGVRVSALSDPSSNPFWWALGVDQLLHGLVLIGIAAMALG